MLKQSLNAEKRWNSNMYTWLEDRKCAVWTAWVFFFFTFHFCCNGLLFPFILNRDGDVCLHPWHLLDGEPLWIRTKDPSGRCSMNWVHISVRIISAALQSRFALGPVGSSSHSSYFHSPSPDLLHGDFGCCLSEEEQWMVITFFWTNQLKRRSPFSIGEATDCDVF